MNRCKIIASSANYELILADFDVFKDLDRGDCIYSGRNVLVRYKINGMDIVVKYFKRSLFSSVKYFCRKSKACRSYENALCLISRGIRTPSPIAYIECRGFLNRLLKSAYICEFEESQPIAQVLSSDRYAEVLTSFAEFVSELHSKGILHNDLNSTNVRVLDSIDNKFRFGLIDLNRMDILPKGVRLTERERFMNLVRFSDLNFKFCMFLIAYLKASGLPCSDFKQALMMKSYDCRRIDSIKKCKRNF